MNNAGEAPMDYNRIINGMIRATKLDKTFYAEVENDVSYTRDAWAVVILVSVLGALGAFLGALFGGSVVRAFGTLIWTAVWGVAGFYIWVWLVQYIGTRFFKGQGDFGEVQRCLGFAYSPRVLGILAVIPCVGWLAALAGWVLSIIAGYFAIRESLDMDNTNTILTIVISAVIVIIVGAIIGTVLAGIGLATRSL